MTRLDRRAVLAALASTPGLSLMGSASARAQAVASPIALQGAGATFPAPLYAAWIEQFHRVHPGIKVAYDAVGSGEGVRRFTAGAVDFAASDAAMTDAQIAAVDRGVRLIPATAGMVVLAYNLPGLEAQLKLPHNVYPAILAGEISRWSDPRIVAANPGLTLPNSTIAIVARLDSSGTTFALTNNLSAVSPSWQSRHGAATRIDWPSGAMLVRGNEGVAGRIKVTEGAIGYVEYGFARRLGLPMAELENRAGTYVAATPESGIQALAETVAEMPDNLRIFVGDPGGAASYPIVTYSWLILYDRYQDAEREAAVLAFVRWGLTEGQQQGAELGYIPLPQSVIDRALATLGGIG
ncbi:MAG: phosphate ABC transporter substrate-binding protein PstS [Geminicoccaceae bacterium]